MSKELLLLKLKAVSEGLEKYPAKELTNRLLKDILDDVIKELIKGELHDKIKD